MRHDDPATITTTGGQFGWLRLRRGAICLAMAALLLGAVATLQQPRLAAQDFGLEQHTGTFSVYRDQTQIGVSTCQFSRFPFYTGTLQFTIDHSTNAVSGTLNGSGAAGWKDGAWDTFPDNSDASRLHYWNFISARCDGATSDGLALARYVSYVFHGTAQATLQGTYDPVSNQIRLEGDASLNSTIRLIDCTDTDSPTMGRTLPTRPCRLNFNNQGISLDDMIKSGQEVSGVQTQHVVLSGLRQRSTAGGSIDVPSVIILGLPVLDTLAVWTTSFTPPAATATPTATSAATPTATARPGPTGQPPTVCTDCDDATYAQQQAAQWAYSAASAGYVYSGATGTPATAAQVADSQEKLRQCIVSTLATERQKPQPQQRSRQQVFNDCKPALPVQIPFG